MSILVLAILWIRYANSWQYQIYGEIHFLVMVHGPVHLPPHILAVTMKHDTPVI